MVGRTGFERDDDDQRSRQERRLGWPGRRQAGAQGAGQAAGQFAGQAEAEQALKVALLRQAACAIRPAGYSDVEWLAAVADAQRLRYPPGEYQQ